MSLVPAREIPNSSIRIILVRIVDGHKPILDLLFLSNVWFEEGSLLDHVRDGVIRVCSSWAWARTSSCKIWLFLIDSILGTELFNNRDWSFIKLDHWQAGAFLTSSTRYWRFLIVLNLEEASSDSSPVGIHGGGVLLQDDVEGLKKVLRNAATSSLDGNVDL